MKLNINKCEARLFIQLHYVTQEKTERIQVSALLEIYIYVDATGLGRPGEGIRLFQGSIAPKNNNLFGEYIKIIYDILKTKDMALLYKNHEVGCISDLAKCRLTTLIDIDPIPIMIDNNCRAKIEDIMTISSAFAQLKLEE